MHNPVYAAALRQSVAGALEEMFFVGDLGEGPAGAQPAPPEIAARVDFVGAPSGWLTLRTSLACARCLAADFLGEDERSLSAEQTSDVFTELANIVCGAVLTRTESSLTFHISSPRLISADSLGEPSSGCEYVAELPAGPLVVFLNMEAPDCPADARFAS
jgi:CheY-specific phosphatase CheX